MLSNFSFSDMTCKLSDNIEMLLRGFEFIFCLGYINILVNKTINWELSVVKVSATGYQETLRCLASVQTLQSIHLFVVFCVLVLRRWSRNTILYRSPKIFKLISNLGSDAFSFIILSFLLFSRPAQCRNEIKVIKIHCITVRDKRVYCLRR